MNKQQALTQAKQCSKHEKAVFVVEYFEDSDYYKVCRQDEVTDGEVLAEFFKGNPC